MQYSIVVKGLYDHLSGGGMLGEATRSRRL